VPQHRQLRLKLILCLTLAAVTMMSAIHARAQATVIYSFGAYPSDGETPFTPNLVADSAGNLYGTSEEGGSNCGGVCGTVFELSPLDSGAWTEQVIHSFDGTTGTEGQTSLAVDGYGNLYGIATYGGTYGYGVVFEMTPSSGGAWTYTVLHNFKYVEGSYPVGGLILDASGKLYGVTQDGGAYGYGTVFQLRKSSGGAWIEKVLHSFNKADGWNPSKALVMDAVGNLFGTTYNGGANSAGTVFELEQGTGDTWQEKVIHSFFPSPSTDGSNPDGGVIIFSGTLFGTTYHGGAYGWGTVFQLVKESTGWRETIIHSFNQDGIDGATPRANLTPVASNLYGTTTVGGASYDGTVFELTPAAGGGWTENVMYSFDDAGGGAAFPSGGLFYDNDGNLYGTAQGGAYGVGSVYQIAR
jgi:uncharacterized repeat protein (TIGR03803 family)